MQHTPASCFPLAKLSLVGPESSAIAAEEHAVSPLALASQRQTKESSAPEYTKFGSLRSKQTAQGSIWWPSHRRHNLRSPSAHLRR